MNSTIVPSEKVKTLKQLSQKIILINSELEEISELFLEQNYYFSPKQLKYVRILEKLKEHKTKQIIKLISTL